MKNTLSIGIYNIGATCYFNCIMQLLFRIPKLKEKIMSFPKIESSDLINLDLKYFENNYQTLPDKSIQFVGKLKQFFYRYINEQGYWIQLDEELINIFNRTTKYNPEDFFEQIEFVLWAIIGAFHLVDKITADDINEKEVKDIVLGRTNQKKDCIYCKAFLEDQITNDFFQILICNKDIKSSLANELISEKQSHSCHHNQNIKEIIKLEKKIEFLPQFLFLEIQRIENANQSFQPLTIEKEILIPSLDLTLSNFEKIKITELEEEKNQIENEIDNFTQFDGQSMPVEEIYKKFQEFIKLSQNLLTNSSQKHIKDQALSLEQLDQINQAFSKQGKGVAEEIKNYQQKLQEITNKINSQGKLNNTFQLFAIIIHDDQTQHYYIIIYNKQKQIWKEYNDSKVSEYSQLQFEEFQKQNSNLIRGIIYEKINTSKQKHSAEPVQYQCLIPKQQSVNFQSEEIPLSKECLFVTELMRLYNNDEIEKAIQLFQCIQIFEKTIQQWAIEEQRAVYSVFELLISKILDTIKIQANKNDEIVLTK